MRSIISLMKKVASPTKSKRAFLMVVEKDSAGFFVGVIPELPGCQTQGRTRAELTRRMREAIEAYLEAETEHPRKIDFIGIQQIEVAL